MGRTEYPERHHRGGAARLKHRLAERHRAGRTAPVQSPALRRDASGPRRPGTTRTSGFDIELSDTNKGDSFIWALGFGKSWDWGLDFDYTYSHQNVRDINPATSSVASSNYIADVAADPNHPALSTSNYQILYENRLNINFEHHILR